MSSTIFGKCAISIFIKLFLLLNKMQSVSTTSHLLRIEHQQDVSSQFGSWVGLYTVDLLYMEAKDGRSNSV